MKTKKKTGRRLKKDWRRKIDVTDVDEFLDEKRLEERIGYNIKLVFLIKTRFSLSQFLLCFKGIHSVKKKMKSSFMLILKGRRKKALNPKRNLSMRL